MTLRIYYYYFKYNEMFTNKNDMMSGIYFQITQGWRKQVLVASWPPPDEQAQNML